MPKKTIRNTTGLITTVTHRYELPLSESDSEQLKKDLGDGDFSALGNIRPWVEVAKGVLPKRQHPEYHKQYLQAMRAGTEEPLERPIPKPDDSKSDEGFAWVLLERFPRLKGAIADGRADLAALYGYEIGLVIAEATISANWKRDAKSGRKSREGGAKSGQARKAGSQAVRDKFVAVRQDFPGESLNRSYDRVVEWAERDSAAVKPRSRQAVKKLVADLVKEQKNR